MSVAVSQRLQELRRRLAVSENLEVITDIRRAARRFAERTDLREAFAILVAGCDEKRWRIRAASATQRQALAANRASTTSPGIEMKIGAWAIDEFGNPSRVIWNAADGPTPP
jgi:ABC-type branched-subunit amino acid transport system ATPase component